MPFTSEIQPITVTEHDLAARHEANLIAVAEASNLFYVPRSDRPFLGEAVRIAGRMIDDRDPEFKAYADEIGLSLNDSPRKIVAAEAEYEARRRDPGFEAFNKLVNDTYGDIIKRIDSVLGGKVVVPEQRVTTEDVFKKSSQQLINQAKAENPISGFDKLVNKIIDVTKAEDRTIVKAVFDCYQALEDRASKRDFREAARLDAVVINPDTLKQAVACARAGLDAEKIKKGVAMTAAAAAAVTALAINSASENPQGTESQSSQVVTSQLIGPVAQVPKKVISHSPAVLAGAEAKKPVSTAKRADLVEQAQVYSKVLIQHGQAEAAKVQANKAHVKGNVHVISTVDGLIRETVKQRLDDQSVALTPEIMAAATEHLANTQLAVRYPAAIGHVALKHDQLALAQKLQTELFAGGNDTYTPQEQQDVVSVLISSADAVANNQTPNSVIAFASQPTPEATPATTNGLTEEQQHIIDNEVPSDHKAFFTMAVTALNGLDSSLHVNKAVVLAQTSLESANGTSQLAQLANNYFGVKANPKAWDGPTVEIVTHEYRHGRMVPETASFRKYASFEESLADYVKFVCRDRYKDATDNYQDSGKYLDGLRDGGYFTDNTYKEKILSVIDANHIGELYTATAATAPAPAPAPTPSAEAPAPAPVTAPEDTPAPADMSLEQQVEYLRSHMNVTVDGYKAFQINKQYMGAFDSELPGNTIKPDFMVMHWTGNDHPYKSVEQFIGSIKNREGDCCNVQRFIARDGQVYQFLPMNQEAYQAYGYNEKSVGTEIDATGSSTSIGGDEGYTPKQMEAMVYSTYQAQLEDGMPIGREGVKGHKEIDHHSGKIDGPKEVVDLIGEQISQLHAQLNAQ